MCRISRCVSASHYCLPHNNPFLPTCNCCCHFFLPLSPLPVHEPSARRASKVLVSYCTSVPPPINCLLKVGHQISRSDNPKQNQKRLSDSGSRQAKKYMWQWLKNRTKVPLTVAQNQDKVFPFVQELMYPISDAASLLKSLELCFAFFRAV